MQSIPIRAPKRSKPSKHHHHHHHQQQQQQQQQQPITISDSNEELVLIS